MDLIEVEQTKPKWKELQEKLGIRTLEIKGRKDPGLENYWQAERDGAFSFAESERSAVITLIHQCKLEGWETVSIES